MEAPQGQPQDPPSPATVESRMRRLKPMWRVLLISNLALGAYMFAKVRQKNVRKEENRSRRKRVEDARKREEASAEQSSVTLELEPPLSPSPPVVAKVTEPLPEVQQRELFQWILEEKRKHKPKDQQEKKQTDQEKALLKRFIRAESIPKL